MEIKEYNNHLFVEVPEDAKDISIERITTGLMDMTFLCLSRKTQIPNGQYSIVGLAKNLTEEQWEGIVEEWIVYSQGNVPDYFYRNYLKEEIVPSNYSLYTKRESGLSLLKSLGLNGNVLILKKQL